MVHYKCVYTLIFNSYSCSPFCRHPYFFICVHTLNGRFLSVGVTDARGVPRPSGAAVLTRSCQTLRRRIVPFGLHLSQLPVLAAVALFGDSGATMSKLAQAVLMDRTTLTRSILPLERAGLLRVARPPEDARTKVVVITRAGERMIESIFPVWERVFTRIKKTLGEHILIELIELRAQLDEVIGLRGRQPPMDPRPGS
jgi:DNA-binding MarR family transcriptional regulator